MTQLEPCPHCARHVKISEAACPFCARSLADAFATRAPRVAPRARLGRAATFAFGVLAMSACGDNEKRVPSQDVTIDIAPAASAAAPATKMPQSAVRRSFRSGFLRTSGQRQKQLSAT